MSDFKVCDNCKDKYHSSRGIGTKEPVAPLTDHPKYCRLSKQLGGLCGRRRDLKACISFDNRIDIILSDWEQCPRPELQQSFELPKPDPLEGLIKAYTKEIYECYETYNIVEIERVIREFAEKVRAL